MNAFLVKIFLLGIASLLATVLAQSQRNPNPCEGVPGNTLFRNDWSSCSTYFWCDNGVAVHTVPCGDGMGFDETRQMCTRAGVTCEQCPANQDIAVSSK